MESPVSCAAFQGVFSKNDKIPFAKSDAEVFTDNFPFQEFNSKELINIQNVLRAKDNLIKNTYISMFNL